jgi:hypothetical protein
VQALGVCLALALPASLPACSSNGAPALGALNDQQAAVNVELALSLSATDPDGDPLTFTFDANLPNIQTRGRIEDGGDGEAVFRWTPLISDVGPQRFTFTVSDGKTTDAREVTIDIAPPEGSTAPMFVQPLGTGSTLDLTKQSCIEVPLAVTDPDSPSVTLAQEEPLVTGGELTQDDALSGAWSFCPSKAQIATDDRYTVVLSADDGDNPKTLKDYLIVLRSDGGVNCPGEPPVVVHEAQDVSTVNEIVVTATVTDDVGMKYEPLLYYSTTPPSDPPDVTEMTQLTMSLDAGDNQDGQWSVAIPNPVANQPAGSSAQLYYVIAATDNDDPMGTCDHTTQAPKTGSYAITVDNPGTSGGKASCESCTADAQCGGSADGCVFFDSAYYCLDGCQGDADCPSGTYCSFGSFTSIDNAVGRHCVPQSFSCTSAPPPPPSCQDDALEDNDAIEQAASLPSGTTSLVSCPGEGSSDDEDFYSLAVGNEGTLDVELSGGSASDLDLVLYDGSGQVIDVSASASSTESVTACLPAGTYYVRVHAYGTPTDNPYSLSWNLTAESCGGTCVDDGNEPDDDAVGARVVDLDLGTYTSASQTICSGNEDWFGVLMYAGETLHSTLSFLQTSASEDLDLWIFDDLGNNLTNCNEGNPGLCDPFNGQSGTSNETLAWEIPTTGVYYVVVHGWAGSENDYDICIGLTQFSCP